jgi:hypothetical protein
MLLAALEGWSELRYWHNFVAQRRWRPTATARNVCLALSRRHPVWIDAQGQVSGRTEATPDDPNVPFMRLKGSRKGS